MLEWWHWVVIFAVYIFGIGFCWSYILNTSRNLTISCDGEMVFFACLFWPVTGFMLAGGFIAEILTKDKDR